MGAVTTAALLALLGDLDIRLGLTPDARLRVDGPGGALTDEMRREIETFKFELISRFSFSLSLYTLSTLRLICS